MGSLASAGLTPDPALAHGPFPTPSPHLPQWGRLRPMVEVRPAMAEARAVLEMGRLAKAAKRTGN